MAFLKNLLFAIFATNAIIFLAPGIPPFDIDCVEREYERVKFAGALEPNNKLDEFQMLPTKVQGGATFDYLNVSDGDVIKNTFFFKFSLIFRVRRRLPQRTDIFIPG